MLSNGIIDHEITTDLTTEPVTLEELKKHLNMLFDSDNNEYSFDDDDELLERLIEVSRIYLEEYTGLSFGEKEITIWLNNPDGNIEIPFGPINSILSIKDCEGNEISADNYKVFGGKFKKLVFPRAANLEIKTTAGYSELPEDLKQAILEEAAYRYNHRGDEADSKGYCKGSLELAAPKRRVSCLA